MFRFFTKLLTKKLTAIPLFIVYFNYPKYKTDGKKGSCLTKIHPVFNGDKYLETELKMLIDYIRDNYDMEELI